MKVKDLIKELEKLPQNAEIDIEEDYFLDQWRCIFHDIPKKSSTDDNLYYMVSIWMSNNDDWFNFI